ncbi:MAG: hypothetical protein AAGC63_00155 [Propionicimonas sp.]|nr:hypothetical protein [Propionicimonas sp.]
MLRFGRTWPYLLAMALVYLAPAAMGPASALWGDQRDPVLLARAVWGYLALFIYPFACMVVSFFAGWRVGRVWLLPILAAAMSVPFSLYYIGKGAQGLVSAGIVLVIYLAFGMLGWFLGYQVHKRQALVED